MVEDGGDAAAGAAAAAARRAGLPGLGTGASTESGEVAEGVNDRMAAPCWAVRLSAAGGGGAAAAGEEGAGAGAKNKKNNGMAPGWLLGRAHGQRVVATHICICLEAIAACLGCAAARRRCV